MNPHPRLLPVLEQEVLDASTDLGHIRVEPSAEDGTDHSSRGVAEPRKPPSLEIVPGLPPLAPFELEKEVVVRELSDKLAPCSLGDLDFAMPETSTLDSQPMSAMPLE